MDGADDGPARPSTVRSSDRLNRPRRGCARRTSKLVTCKAGQASHRRAATRSAGRPFCVLRIAFCILHWPLRSDANQIANCKLHFAICELPDSRSRVAATADRARHQSFSLLLALICLAPLLAGCSSGRMLMVDPTGDRFFIWGPVVRHPEPKPAHCHDPVRIELSPAKVIAPVGCEVVMTASVCGGDGYTLARQPVEWMLSSGGVGEFLVVGRRSPLDWLVGFHSGPRKVNNTYAVGTTSSSYLCLTRGTPTPSDDLPVDRGQAWVAVTSPVEGVSYLTAYAPSVKGWDSHTQTATIHWIDAEFAYPPPAINPGGSRHTFTTIVTRHSSHAPVEGWRVRYEITGGPPAGFAPDGAPLIEVPTNELGQASAEIYQLETKPGTNTVSIQVIRPADSTGERFIIGQGATQKTWTSPDISLRISGPGQGLVGDTLTYRIDVQNPGDFTAKGVVVSDLLPDGASLVAATPQPSSAAGNLQWSLGDLQGGETRNIALQIRFDRPGTVNHCAGVTTEERLSAQNCVATTVLAPSLRVTMSGPPAAEVGTDVTFQAQITNTGSTTLTGLVIVDRYDDGLQHASESANRTGAIERSLGDLAPGQTKPINITFQVVQAGQQCNSIEVQGSAGVLGSAKACLAAGEPGAASPADQPKLTISKTGPTTAAAGSQATFQISVTNTGQTPATNLTITDHFDVQLEPQRATPGNVYDGASMTWQRARLDPGQTIWFQVVCACKEVADNTCNRVTVECDGGVRESADACLEIVPATSGLQPSIAEQGNPVAVGKQTTYRIAVANNGSTGQNQVVVTVTVPDQTTPVAGSFQGPTSGTASGKTVQFAPVASLAAGKTLNFTVGVTADRAGNGAARVEVTSQQQPTPAAAESTTTVIP
jgi:uncharacterized repeat protein (TIGR01451 family)